MNDEDAVSLAAHLAVADLETLHAAVAAGRDRLERFHVLAGLDGLLL
jgi:hypothetical protein